MTEIPSEFPLPDSSLERQRSVMRAYVEATQQSSRRRIWRVAATAAVILVCGLLIPPFSVGGRLLDLIRDEPIPPGVSSPTWSPDGRKIAFIFGAPLDYELRVINADGSGRRTLAQGADHPVWSPDGQKIAFLGSRGIAVVNVDGSGRRLLSAERSDHWPVWSPDGRRIAFARDVFPQPDSPRTTTARL